MCSHVKRIPCFFRLCKRKNPGKRIGLFFNSPQNNWGCSTRVEPLRGSNGLTAPIILRFLFICLMRLPICWTKYAKFLIKFRIEGKQPPKIFLGRLPCGITLVTNGKFQYTEKMSELIQPKVLKGFRDFLPRDEIRRSLLIETVTNVFRNAGFVPIDTPALEYSEVLLRKSNGETEKQVFRFNDNGGRDIALRFDLTVPFARFIAEHYSELYFPFKRYHIAKVWRGEKPQAGRYREFIQCDFDSVGSDCAYTDFEILKVMYNALKALGVTNFRIHISHRGIFNRFLDRMEIKDKSEDILRIVDKLAKIGKEEVVQQLSEIAGAEKAEQIVQYSNSFPVGADFETVLAHIEALAGGAAPDTGRLREVYQLLCDAGIAGNFVLDPSITRGLDYYTGIVYETFLTDLPQLGSVCSGGRYDNLTGLYMKDTVSGVGASIGLDRLLAGLEQLGIVSKNADFIDAVIFYEKNNSIRRNSAAADYLERNGIRVEVFPEPKKIQQQYGYAEKKGLDWGLFIEPLPEGSDSNSEPAGVSVSLALQNCAEMPVRLKHLPTRKETHLLLKDVPASLKGGKK